MLVIRSRQERLRFRGIKDVLASVIANERRSEGYWGIGTYYALTVQDAEDLLTVI